MCCEYITKFNVIQKWKATKNKEDSWKIIESSEYNIRNKKREASRIGNNFKIIKFFGFTNLSAHVSSCII